MFGDLPCGARPWRCAADECHNPRLLAVGAWRSPESGQTLVWVESRSRFGIRPRSIRTPALVPWLKDVPRMAKMMVSLRLTVRSVRALAAAEWKGESSQHVAPPLWRQPVVLSPGMRCKRA